MTRAPMSPAFPRASSSAWSASTATTPCGAARTITAARRAISKASSARYVDLADARAHERLYAVEKRNLALFGYGVKGMVLSMIEAAVEITDARISASDLHRIVALGKSLLQHPVELLPGIREAVEAIGAQHEMVLITKGDLFHQEAKVKQSGLADLFRRIEIVSEKDRGDLCARCSTSSNLRRRSSR